jgi:hypothetical protein
MIRIIFAGNDYNEDLRFVEIENSVGESICVGKWTTDDQGYKVLEIENGEL